MPELPTIPINVPGALGVDLRSDATDVSALACLDMNGMDLFPAAEGTRVLPRRWFRRFGQRAGYVTAAAQGAGAFTGNYQYAWVLTDGVGRTHFSWQSAAASPNASASVRVSGWIFPGVDARVAIYRTTSGGSVLKLVVSGWAANFYDDSTADGALGADIPAVPVHMDPLGNDRFAQSALCQVLLGWRNSAGTRVISALVCSDGPTSVTRYYEGYPDTDELLREAAFGSNADDRPAKAVVFWNRLWVAAGGANLYYSKNLLGLAAANQPDTPTSLGVSAGPAGPPDNLAAAIGHLYAVQSEDLLTGIRSAAAGPIDTGAYAARQYNVVSFFVGSEDARHHIYRTTDGGGIFQFVATLTSTSSGTLTYHDSTPDASLSLNTLPFEVGAPGGARVVFVHKGVLIVANTTSSPAKPKRVRWMSTLYPVNFPADPERAADFETQVDADDGDAFEAGESFGETAVLWGANGVWLMTGDPPNFRFSKVDGSDGLGCAAHRTVVSTPVGVWWLCPSGIALMTAAGERPRKVSDAINPVFVETQRAANRGFTAPVTEDPPELVFWYQQQDCVGESFHFQVQLDVDPLFGSIDFDYTTQDATERGYFRAAERPVGASGVTLRPGARVRIRVRPPSGGPVAGTTYAARARAHDGYEWSEWETLFDFQVPTDTPWADPLDWSRARWAHAVHYAEREEVWFHLPTGGRSWCDVAWIASYGPMLRGESAEPLWRPMRLPSSCSVKLQALAVGSQAAEPLILLASPDGVLYVYPYVYDGYDFDARITLADVDRVFTGTHNPPLIVCTGVVWPLDGPGAGRYGLRGTLLVARRQSNGETFVGIIIGNGESSLELEWLGGRVPGGGDYDCVIGGLDAYVRSAWFALGEDAAHTQTVCDLVLHSAAGGASLDLIVRSSRSGSRPTSGYYRRRKRQAVGRGHEIARMGAALYGHYHQVRYGTIETAQLWEVLRLHVVDAGEGARQ